MRGPATRRISLPGGNPVAAMTSVMTCTIGSSAAYFDSERGLNRMPVRVGINGFGRIGRNVFRAAQAKNADIEWVAVNDLTDTKTLAQLSKYDSILGPYPGTIEVDGDSIVVDGKPLKVLAERDPANLPWSDLGADVVVESTGFFTKRADAQKHIDA